MSEQAHGGVRLRHLTPAEALAWIEENAGGGEGTAEFPSALPIAEIESVECLFQPRAVAEWHVMDIARGIKAGRKPDPLLVFAVGGRNLLLDGHHRLAAYRAAGIVAAVRVAFFTGSAREAVLEARARNSETKLPMSASERLDDAWRLVKLEGHSKSAICRATRAAKLTVEAMRRVLKTLGAEEAAEIKSWQRARMQALGKAGDKSMTDSERQAWEDEMAEGWADRMAKHFGTKMATQPEIAAQALAHHFGRSLGELVRHLKGHLPERAGPDGLGEDDF